MARGLVDTLTEGYRSPRAAMARQRARGLTEERVLAWLIGACGIGCAASLPAALGRAGAIPAEDPIAAVVAAQLFGFLFLAPLLLYALAGLVHLIARGFGGRGGFLAARAALFWSLLLAAPAALGLALIGAWLRAGLGAPVLPWLGLLRYAGFALWLWIFAACLAEVEGFARSWRVAAVAVAVLGGLAAGLAALPGPAAPAA